MIQCSSSEIQQIEYLYPEKEKQKESMQYIKKIIKEIFVQKGSGESMFVKFLDLLVINY